MYNIQKHQSLNEEIIIQELQALNKVDRCAKGYENLFKYVSRETVYQLTAHLSGEADPKSFKEFFKKFFEKAVADIYCNWCLEYQTLLFKSIVDLASKDALKASIMEAVIDSVPSKSRADLSVIELSKFLANVAPMGFKTTVDLSRYITRKFNHVGYKQIVMFDSCVKDRNSDERWQLYVALKNPYYKTVKHVLHLKEASTAILEKSGHEFVSA